RESGGVIADEEEAELRDRANMAKRTKETEREREQAEKERRQKQEIEEARKRAEITYGDGGQTRKVTKHGTHILD
ncbi:hypothetical protein KIPB_016403, partial [Kipferlia bialata]